MDEVEDYAEAGQTSGHADAQCDGHPRTDIGIPRMRPGMIAMCAATAVGIGQIALAYDGMPERVVSHFDLQGNADGWSSKASFAILMGLLHAFMATMFGGIGAVLGRIPDSLINLPNKAMWLAPERRQDTIDWIANRLAWFGFAVQALFCAVVRLSLMASGEDEALPPWTHWTLFAVFFGFLAVWVVGFLTRFARSPA